MSNPRVTKMNRAENEEKNKKQRKTISEDEEEQVP